MDRKILRVLDANFNRTKEGLRVIEDIFRFVFEEDTLRKKIRTLRHSLDRLLQAPTMRKAFFQREPLTDIGKHVDVLECSRESIYDVLYANFQRAKESLRVLEECLKIIDPARVASVKRMRYRVYALEKEVLRRFFKRLHQTT